MRANRSIPSAAVIPVLAYPDVHAAAEWLAGAFGFKVRLRIGSHRVQMHASGGAVTLREMRPEETQATLGSGHSITVRVEDVDAHYSVARQHGAGILQEPETHPYGERQYNAVDPWGHPWTFSQSVNDVDPGTWGGELVSEGNSHL